MNPNQKTQYPKPNEELSELDKKLAYAHEPDPTLRMLRLTKEQVQKLTQDYRPGATVRSMPLNRNARNYVRD